MSALLPMRTRRDEAGHCRLGEGGGLSWSVLATLSRARVGISLDGWFDALHATENALRADRSA